MFLYLRRRRRQRDELRWVVHRLGLFLRLFKKYAWMQLLWLHVLFACTEPDTAPDAPSHAPSDAAANRLP